MFCWFFDVIVVEMVMEGGLCVLCEMFKLIEDFELMFKFVKIGFLDFNVVDFWCDMVLVIFDVWFV